MAIRNSMMAGGGLEGAGGQVGRWAGGQVLGECREGHGDNPCATAVLRELREAGCG